MAQIGFAIANHRAATWSTSRAVGSEYLRPGDLAYQIGLTCEGNFLLLHVNGKLFRKIDITRFELTSGRIGVSFASFEETPMIATFDWVRVDPPAQ